MGQGWQNFKTVFAGGDGIVYAMDPNGDLHWYRHNGRADGSFNWSGPTKVGTGWQNFKSVFGYVS